MFQSDPSQYRLAGTLSDHAKSVICVSVNERRTLLASGSEDQSTKIWDLRTRKCVQTLRGRTWGQITCLQWLGVTAALSFGTGRGLIAIYKPDEQGRFHEITVARAFDESMVEALSYDATNGRLGATSHHGLIRLWRMTLDEGNLEVIWTSPKWTAIPRSIQFLDNDRSFAIFGLENGEM